MFGDQIWYVSRAVCLGFGLNDCFNCLLLYELRFAVINMTDVVIEQLAIYKLDFTQGGDSRIFSGKCFVRELGVF